MGFVCYIGTSLWSLLAFYFCSLFETPQKYFYIVTSLSFKSVGAASDIKASSEEKRKHRPRGSAYYMLLIVNTYVTAPGIMVHISKATSVGSGKPANLLRLAKPSLIALITY